MTQPNTRTPKSAGQKRKAPQVRARRRRHDPAGSWFSLGERARLKEN